jgi:hypothetical protein
VVDQGQDDVWVHHLDVHAACGVLPHDHVAGQ